jgi:hypothetical protein
MRRSCRRHGQLLRSARNPEPAATQARGPREIDAGLVPPTATGSLFAGSGPDALACRIATLPTYTGYSDRRRRCSPRPSAPSGRVIEMSPNRWCDASRCRGIAIVLGRGSGRTAMSGRRWASIPARRPGVVVDEVQESGDAAQAVPLDRWPGVGRGCVNRYGWSAAKSSVRTGA